MRNKKIRALIASLIINLCIGSIYAWSVFAGPLSESFGWSASATALTFTIANGVGPVTMIIGGRLQDMYGPKWVVLAGAFLFGGGMFASGFVESVTMMYVTYGLCMGFGLGTIYTCTIANTVKLFPERKGLISGATTCVYGLATVVAAPLAQKLIVMYGVSAAFRILGEAYFIIVAVCSQFLIKAEVSTSENSAGCSIDKTWRQMLTQPSFYVFLIMLLFGATSGLMIISQASIIAQELIKVGAATAAAGVSIIAIANALGRIILGRISDRAGRYTVLTGMFIILAVSMLALTSVGEGQWILFLILVMAAGFCFGGFMGIFPALTAEKFGIINNGVNYGFMFIGFAVGGYIGPKLATALKITLLGMYSMAFVIAAAMAAAGIAVAAVLNIRDRRAACET